MVVVIQNGAHQYRVKLGQFIRMEKMELAPGSVWKCSQVLALQNDKGELVVGQPCLDKTFVEGRVIRHGRNKKLLVFKKKRRKGYRRTQGHRQEFTEIYIEGVNTPTEGKLEKKLEVSKKASVKEASAKPAPVKKASVKEASTKPAPVKKASVKEASAKPAPVKKASVKEASAKPAPVKKASVKEASAKPAPVKKASVKEASAKPAPVKKASVKEASAKPAPVKKASVKEASAKPAPVKKASVKKKAPTKTNKG